MALNGMAHEHSIQASLRAVVDPKCHYPSSTMPWRPPEDPGQNRVRVYFRKPALGRDQASALLPTTFPSPRAEPVDASQELSSLTV